MDHVVIAIYFVGFLGWFVWHVKEAERSDFVDDSAWISPISLPAKFLIILVVAAISYALLLALFYGASWLVHLAIEAIDPPCIPKPAWYGDGRGCM